MVKSDFENLRVYQLAESLADEIWNIVGRWEQFAKDTVGKQIVRSVDSIGANIAEGRGQRAGGRGQGAGGRGSLNETRYWLRRAYTRNLLTQEQVSKLRPIVDELSPTLNAYLKSIGNIPEKSTDN